MPSGIHSANADIAADRVTPGRFANFVGTTIALLTLVLPIGVIVYYAPEEPTASPQAYWSPPASPSNTRSPN
jgi:hypothetical protein